MRGLLKLGAFLVAPGLAAFLVWIALTLRPDWFEKAQITLGAAVVAGAGALAIKAADQVRERLAGDKEGKALRRLNNVELMMRLRETIGSLDILVATDPGDTRLPAATRAFKAVGEFLTHWDSVRFELPTESKSAWRDTRTLVSKLYLALDLDGDLKAHSPVIDYLAKTRAALGKLEQQHDLG